MAEQPPSGIPRHGVEGDCRPTEVRREIVIYEVRACPGLEFQLVHLLLSCLKSDDGTVILPPVLDFGVLTEFPHEFGKSMTRLRYPLALGEFLST